MHSTKILSKGDRVVIYKYYSTDGDADIDASKRVNPRMSPGVTDRSTARALFREIQPQNKKSNWRGVRQCQAGRVIDEDSDAIVKFCERTQRFFSILMQEPIGNESSLVCYHAL